jgi:hypothetical protein
MRQIYIDLTSERAKPPAQSVGCVGEHNATELLLAIPQALVDASDYQVVVFQSGPLTYRSRRIYPDSDKNSAYRDGACIHCLLGRHLTEEQRLGLQVEGWKLSSDGQPLLIGKTVFLPRLTLTASPQGRPGLGFDGSYEDIRHAIDHVHKHENITALMKVGTDENGDLTFDGKPIGSGAVKYVTESPDELPSDAAEGTLAYVKKDTVTGAGAAIDLSDCPNDRDIDEQIRSDYTAQGGVAWGSEWANFYNNYTNCHFPNVKLGIPVYTENYSALIESSLSFYLNYRADTLDILPVFIRVSDSIDNNNDGQISLSPDGDFSFEYMPGCSLNLDHAELFEIEENGIQKYKMTAAYVFAFEALDGEVYGTDDVFDGMRMSFVDGWNTVSMICIEDDDELMPERLIAEPAGDIFLPPAGFWSICVGDAFRDDDEMEAEAVNAVKRALSCMLIDMTKQSVIPKGLYIRTDDKWRRLS